MASLGAQLKLAREKRGVTLEDISSSTKIGTRLLRAIEDEQFDQLPGGIFNKGFVRAYAKAVGLDEEKAISDYLAATEPAPPVGKNEGEAQSRVADPRPEADEGEGGISWGLLAVMLVLVALGFAGWGYYSREVRKSEAQADAERVRSSAVTPTAAQTAPAQVEGGAKLSPGSQIVPTSNNAVTEAGAAPAVAPPASKAENTSGLIGSTGSGPQAGYFSVHVRVRQDSWMSISSDGKTVLQGTIVAPAVKSVRARNQIVVKAGNVGALDFEFNGEKLASQGQNGEVKVLTFGAEGLEAIQSPGKSTP